MEGGGKERIFDLVSLRKGEIRERNCMIGSCKIICRVFVELMVGVLWVRVVVYYVVSGKFVCYFLGVIKCCLFMIRVVCYCVFCWKLWLCFLILLVIVFYIDLYM